jgi:phage portal protein BeeE
MVQPVLQRIIFLLRKQGRIEIPTVNGREVKIKSVSPLAQAQSNQDIVSFDRFLELIQGRFGPEVTNLLVSSEEAAVYLAKKFGVPDNLIRDVGERKQIVEMAQQMQQQGIEQNVQSLRG